MGSARRSLAHGALLKDIAAVRGTIEPTTSGGVLSRLGTDAHRDHVVTCGLRAMPHRRTVSSKRLSPPRELQPERDAIALVRSFDPIPGIPRNTVAPAI